MQSLCEFFCATDDPKSSSDEDEPLPGVAAVLTSTPTLPRRAMALEDGFGKCVCMSVVLELCVHE